MEGFDKETKSVGALEQLRDRIFELKKESLDPYFTEYLANLQERVIKEKHTVDLLYDELERKYKFYLERLEKQAKEAAEESAEALEAEAVTPDTPKEANVQASMQQGITIPERAVYTVDAPARAAVKNKKDSEFTIGIVAFSAVGVFFLLAAFVMLGEYFMNSVAKGIAMYTAPLIICIFSECLVRRRSEKFSLVLTILGVSGLNVATMVNVDSLLHMNLPVAGIVTVIITIFAMLYDKLRRRGAWGMNGISAGAYYGFAVTAFKLGVAESETVLAQLVVMSILLVLTRLLARDKAIYPLDAIVTTLYVIFLFSEVGTVYGYILLGVLLLSALFIRFWHLYYQCLITLATMIFVALLLESEIVLTLIVAIVWLFMLLFNHVGMIRGKSMGAYNCFALVLQTLCFLYLPLADFEMYKILYFILAFLGGGFIYFMFQEKYYLPEKGKGLVLSLFLSYMVLVTDFTYPIATSILLLIIGLVCIGCGFAFVDKKVRIYGLVQALCVCVKITLFDFAEGEPLQRMILFFAAGVVALMISGIYILLEKKYMKD